MRAKKLGITFVISLLVCIGTVESLNLIFWVSLIVFARTSYLISKHQKELESELDEMFGKDV